MTSPLRPSTNIEDTHGALSLRELKAASDEDLLRYIQHGNRPAYDLIMQRYLSKVWRLAVSVLKNEQDADDAVQDIFLKLWQHSDKWDPNGSASFATWIYKMALNKCIDIRRSKIRKAETSQDAAPEQTAKEDAYKLMFRKQLSENLGDLIRTLPDGQQRVIFLHYFREMSVAEISEHMKASEQSVRSLLKRGRKTLREKAAFAPNLKSADISDIAALL